MTRSTPSFDHAVIALTPSHTAMPGPMLSVSGRSMPPKWQPESDHTGSPQTAKNNLAMPDTCIGSCSLVQHSVERADCGPSLRPVRRFRMGKKRSSAVPCTGEAAHLWLPSPHRPGVSGDYSVRGASPTLKRVASSFGRLRFRRRDPIFVRSAAITGSSPWLGPYVSLCETSGNSFESFISPLS